MGEEREAFEAQYERAVGHKPKRSWISYPHANPDGYENGHANSMWKWWKWGWQASRQSAGATGWESLSKLCGLVTLNGVQKCIKEPCACAAPIGDNGAKEQIERYQKICAAAYQLAGLVDAPLRFLDALSDAANGEPMEDGINLLPVTLDECGYAQPAESKRMELTDDELFALIKQVDPRAVRIPPGIRAIADALLARAQAKGA